MANLIIDKLRETFHFKREPDDLGDGGVAFAGFLNFASGTSEEAAALVAMYYADTGKSPCNDMRATPEQTGEFIDWLIETQWGEFAPRTLN